MGIRFHQEIKNTTTELNMKVSFCLLIALAVLLSVLLPEVDAKPRQRSRGRGKFRGARRMQPRRGRQDADVPADDMNAVDYDEAADDAEGSGGEELYNGCDWKTNIGGFLNFCKWRKWCADNQGITDFGPYGGVPTSCPPEEEGAEGADDPLAAAADDAAPVEEELPPVEARRRARARASRARRGRKSGVSKKRPARRGPRKAGRKAGRKNRG